MKNQKTLAIVLPLLAMAGAASAQPTEAVQGCSDSVEAASLCDAAAARIAALMAHDVAALRRLVMCEGIHFESNGRRRRFCNDANSFIAAMEACGKDGKSDPRRTDPNFVMPEGGGFMFFRHGFNRQSARIRFLTNGEGPPISASLSYDYGNILGRCTITQDRLLVPEEGSTFMLHGQQELPAGSIVPAGSFLIERPGAVKAAHGEQTWLRDGEQWRLVAHKAVAPKEQDPAAFSRLYPDALTR